MSKKLEKGKHCTSYHAIAVIPNISAFPPTKAEKSVMKKVLQNDWIMDISKTV